MTKNLLTADQVKEYLNIPDYRHLTKDKLIDFVSAIPYMDKDVAIRIIEQFPEFSSFAKTVVAHYKNICDSILEGNNTSVQAVLDGYKQTLNVLGELAKSDNADAADKRFFAEKMVEVADKMAAFDTNNKIFLSEQNKYFIGFVSVALIVCVAMLDVRFNGIKIPRIA